MQYISNDYSLVISGNKGWKDERLRQKINEFASKGVDIVETGYVSASEKSALFENAHVYVYPSHYEGFGMQIIEAMQHRTPLALSNIAVFKEIAQDAAVYFNKDNPQDIAKKIVQLIDDDELRKNIVSKYPRLLEKFSWENSSKDFLNRINNLWSHT